MFIIPDLSGPAGFCLQVPGGLDSEGERKLGWC